MQEGKLTSSIARSRTLKPPKASIAYLKPEVVFGLVCYFSMIIADVTFPDQAVDGPLVRVSAVPQHTAVVETKFVFGIRWKSRVQGPGGRLECYEKITFARLDAWGQGLEVFLPSVRGGTVHVLLKPGLKISKLMLHSVYDLHGRVQVSTTQAIINHRPDWVALDLTILLPTEIQY